MSSVSNATDTVVTATASTNSAIKATGARGVPFLSTARASYQVLVNGKLPDASAAVGVASDIARVVIPTIAARTSPLSNAVSVTITAKDWAQSHVPDTHEETKAKGLSDGNGFLDASANLINGIRA